MMVAQTPTMYRTLLLHAWVGLSDLSTARSLLSGLDDDGMMQFHGISWTSEAVQGTL